MSARLFLCAAVTGLALWGTACGDEGGGGEVLEGYGAKLSESDIKASISGSALDVSFVIQRTGEGSLSGNLAVDLAKIDDMQLLAQASTRFTLDAAAKEVKASLTAPPVSSPGDLGAYVLSYRVELPDGTLRGWRSLYTAANYSGLVVLGNNHYAAGEKGVLRIIVAHPRTGVGVKDAAVSVSFKSDTTSKTRTLASGKTDYLGRLEASFTFAEADVGAGTISVVAGSHKSSHPVLVEKERQVLLTTDKPLYQPGQIAYIRALAMRQPRLTPVAKEKLLLEVEDPQTNKLYKESALTDAYGIASVKFPLARLLPFGTYTVRVTMGTTVRQKTFQVASYTLPKFKATVTAGKTFYKPGETVKGSVQADYFFNKHVQKAEVKLVASTSAAETPIAEVMGKTDDNGLFSFSVTAPASGQSLLLQATVKDAAGAEAKGSTTVLVSSDTSVLQIVPARSQVASGEEVTFYLLLTDPAGKALPGKVQLGGMTSGTATVPATGIVQVKAKAGVCSSSQMSFSLQAGLGSATAAATVYCVPADAILRLSTDKALYRTGETARVTIKAPAATASAVLDVVRHNLTVASYKVALKGGTGSVDLKLSGDLSRTLELKAHCSVSGSPVSDQQLIFVLGSDHLTVKVTTDKSSYRPADAAKVTLQMTDSTGKPAPGAMGVQVVDEALYSLTEFRPGLERSFFLLEQEVVSAGTALKFLSSSVLLSASPTADDQIRARMLFAAAGEKAVFPINYNSAGVDLPLAISKSHGGIQALVTALGEAYQSAWSSSFGFNLTYGDKKRRQWVEEYLAGRIDSFGVPYQVEASDYLVAIKSAGMDESWGSPDDLYASFDFGGTQWAASKDAAAYADAGGYYPDSAMAPSDAGPATGDGASSTKIRQYFPETLYVDPALITDSQGKATVDLTLADSVTTWKLSTIAHTLSGQLGSAEATLTAFQEFFVDTLLPASLLQNDEVDVPVVVYNYLNVAQTVAVSVQSESWFDLLDSSTKQAAVPARSVGTVAFRIRAKKVGTFSFTATGVGSKESDGVKRSVQVLPDGEKTEIVKSGILKPGTTSETIVIPPSAIDGASELFVKVFPGILSELVEGLESMLKEPYGCFEQTSSATYPNVLILRYLKAAGLSTTALDQKAKSYIEQGYQRLVTYEVPGGGFSLYGASPASLLMSAFGLMEFADMAAVRYVDPALLARTTAFIVGQQQSTGAFVPSSLGCYSDTPDPTTSAVQATAYVAWALSQSLYTGAALTSAVAYVKANVGSIDDTYTQAVAANALLSMSATDSVGLSLLGKLKAKASVSGDKASWSGKGCSLFYGYGQSMDIETTALVTSALLLAKDSGNLTSGGLRHLTASKSGYGGWGTTQASVLALRTLLLALKSRGGDKASGTVQVLHNLAVQSSTTITPATSDVTRLFDLKQVLVEGTNNVDIVFSGTGESAYQVVGIYYLPHGSTTSTGPLDFDVSYDKVTLKVNESIKVTAAVQSTGSGSIPNVLMRIGLPPGFTVDLQELTAAKTGNVVQNAEEIGPYVVLYLGSVSTTQSVSFSMTATMPVKAKAPLSIAYPYYTPEYSQLVDTPVVTVTAL